MTTTAPAVHIHATHRDGVLLLEFDGSRPFDGAFWTQLHDTLDDVDEISVRAVVLGSTSTAFSVGNSAPWLSRTVGAAARRNNPDTALHTAGADMRRAAAALLALTVPTVAVVTGETIGAGTELACLCDLRICVDPVTITLPEAHLGVLPDMAPIDILDDVLGPRVTRRLLLTGRSERLDPTRTESFADYWLPTTDAVQQFVGTLAATFPAGRVVPALRRANDRAATIDRAGVHNDTLTTAAEFRDAVTRLVQADTEGNHP